MDTAFTQKFPFILDRNLTKANCTGNHVCTSCDTVVLVTALYNILSALPSETRERAGEERGQLFHRCQEAAV